MHRPRKVKKRRQSRLLRTEPLEMRSMLHGAAVLSGSVYFDSNSNGIRDAAEVGVPGVVVNLAATDTQVVRSTITNDSGEYTFEELEPGTYTVSKRQASAVLNGQDTTSVADVSITDNSFSNVVLTDDQSLSGLTFGEEGLRSEFISIAYFLASSPPLDEMLRATIAQGEELAGDTTLAAEIRAGGDSVPETTNSAPAAVDDVFSVDQNGVLSLAAGAGVLANDSDADADPLTVSLVSQATNGTVALNADGSFTYTPNSDFVGTDAFTYRSKDTTVDSNLATVTITVNSTNNGPTNQSPVATSDSFSVEQNQVLTVTAALGVLSNDTDADSDPLTATLVSQPTNGTVSLAANGSFTYTPTTGFAGNDSFTYRASDGTANSNTVTVAFTVTAASTGNQLFGSVTAGDFRDSSVLGTRTDLVAGAPAVTANHVDGTIDYIAHSNPPTYGDHHGFDPQGTDSNPGITPRPTGVYTTAQPDEDLIHNLEHGHVWISYNPSLISSGDLAALQQLVIDGSPNSNGGGVGVILTPRAANTSAISLASWARLALLNSYDADTVRNFVEANRGKAPEGFITP